MDISKVILGPVISEKSLTSTAINRYPFYIAKEATKNDVERAVAATFKVDVLDVKIINIRGKKVNFGRKRIAGKKSDRRKAVVTIKAGQKIGIFDFGEEPQKA